MPAFEVAQHRKRSDTGIGATKLDEMVTVWTAKSLKLIKHHYQHLQECLLSTDRANTQPHRAGPYVGAWDRA